MTIGSATFRYDEFFFSLFPVGCRLFRLERSGLKNSGAGNGPPAKFDTVSQF